MRIAIGSIVALCLLLLGTGVYAQQPLIVHDPVTSGTAGEAITITARLEGISIDQVNEAIIRYRQPQEAAFDYIDLYASIDQFEGTIPGEQVTDAGLEYYLEFTLEDGSLMNYPPGGEASAIAIQIRGSALSATESPVYIVSPQPSSLYRDDNILIAVSFNPTIRELDPSRVRLLVNGVNRTREASVSEQLMTAVISDFADGRHRIDIIYDGPAYRETLKTWFFIVNRRVEEREGIFRNTSGQVGFELRQQTYNEESIGIARETAALRTEVGNLRMSGRARITSEESRHYQSQNRYYFSIGMPWWNVKLGDINPRYNELVLWGRRVRGAELQLNSGAFNVWAIYGETSRGVEGRYYGEDVYSPGTYRRWMAATRLSTEAPLPVGWLWGFAFDAVMETTGLTIMKAKDDSSSIDYGSNPKDNLVMGFDHELSFDRRRVTFSEQIALSLYNDNISAGVLEDAADYEDIIVVNQYFQPLPDEGLPTDTSDLKISELVSSILANALSFNTRARFRYYGNDLQISYRLINRSYLSVGNPTIQNDRAGFSVRDRIRLFGSRLYLDLGYSSFGDNVRDKSDITQDTNELLAGFSIYTDENLPDISFRWRQNLTENDGTVSEVPIGTGDSTILIDTRKERAMNYYTVYLNHRMVFMDTENDLTMSMLTSKIDDEYNEFSSNALNQFSLSAVTRYRLPMRTTISYSLSNTSGADGETDLNLHFINARLSYFLFNRKLVPYINPRITLGSGQTALSEDETQSTYRYQHSDFMKIEWTGGFDYEFMRNHTVSGYISMSMYSENGEYEFWDGTRQNIADQPTYRDRDDFLAMLSYSYRF